MASDIQRYLEGKPVIARRDTLSYRSAKFIRRHWLPVATAAGAVFLILAFATTTYMQSLRIAAERDRVAQRDGGSPDRERVRAEVGVRRLPGRTSSNYRTPEENRGSGNQVTCNVKLLDSGAKRLRAGLKDQPETKAALLSTVGAVYDSLGQYRDALPILDESLRLQPQSQDQSRVDTLLEGSAKARLAGESRHESSALCWKPCICRKATSARTAWNRDTHCGYLAS